MKKLTYSVGAALVAVTILAPTAVAQQETTIIEETTVYPEGAPAAGNTGGGAAGDTGGPASDATSATGGTGGSTNGGTGGTMGGVADTTSGSTGGAAAAGGGGSTSATAGTTEGMASGTGGASGGANTEATTVGGPLPTSGGPAILAPAVALLLGSGVVALAVLRRTRW